LALALSIALPCAASTASSSKTSSRPMYWGAWIGTQLTGTQPPWDMSAVSQLQAKIGKGLSLVEFASPFADCGHGPCSFYQFPVPGMENIRTYGAIPFFSWGSQFTPWDLGEPGTNAGNITLAGIVSGSYDSYIEGFAHEAAAWGHPFFLRFNWEMNKNWFPWSNSVGGNNPRKFVAAWRHVHDIFKASGATNATWAWCPFAEARPKARYLRSFYPGNRYVDWTCLDGYNWGTNRVKSQPWRSFDQIFEPAYKLIAQKIAPKKPMVLGEIASSSGGGSKGRWIRQMMNALPKRYPKVRGLVWFDTVDRGIDWPLESSPGGLRAFARGINASRLGYTANEYSTIATSPIKPPG
jgi:Glycosyl hydrolase family 26